MQEIYGRYDDGKSNKLILSILAVGVLLLILLLLASAFEKEIGLSKDTARLEIFKAMTQFVSLGMLGAVIAGLVRVYENDRKSAQDAAAKRALDEEQISRRKEEKLNNYREHLSSYYRKLRDVYKRSKMVRRMLRAKSRFCIFKGPCPSRTDPRKFEEREVAARVISRNDYFEMMSELESIQLELETFKMLIYIDIPSMMSNEEKGIAKKDVDEMYDCLRAAERYLGAVCNDFEYNNYAFDEENIYITSETTTFEFIANSFEISECKTRTDRDESYFGPLRTIWTTLGRAIMEIQRV